ncbi:response regulator transcription factor [Ruegeria lacuscaerulensis]|uniref:response regulator transcription factor n=1 Tax=Ruegeria lacuscaerulensis TaxID=55218 RepID=UPI001480D117|nr:response regulator transcription factor [Ruegeria lacuscaerulensis]
MRILVVEDNERLAETICRSLSQMGHAVDTVDDGQLADELLASQGFDLVVLDLSLPGLDGLEVLKHMRRRGTNIPVLVLTARSRLEDRVGGLNLGADDYLTKPFELAELDARVSALLRRRPDTKPVTVELGPLKFDTINRAAHLSGKPVELTPRERSVLEILIANHGAVMSKDRIAEHLYSFDDEAGVSTVEFYIHRLRRKLGRHSKLIRTVRGLGYMLDT